MNDFISKPFDALTVVRSIRRHVLPAPMRDGIARSPTPAQTPAALSWPEIRGIDSSDVRFRLNDELPLFLSMLRRLLKEFPQDSFEEASLVAGVDATRASRMHKLRGSAGILGAKTIADLAGQVERACLDGRADVVADLHRRLAAALQTLRQSAAPSIAEMTPCGGSAAGAGGDELDPEVLSELIDLLRQQSLSALDRFNAVSHTLRGVLDANDYARLGGMVDDLRFNEAADLLDAMVTSKAPIDEA
jgi:HPt (histidine-containing phosphotransfer) domain-containing protein